MYFSSVSVKPGTVYMHTKLKSWEELRLEHSLTFF